MSGDVHDPRDPTKTQYPLLDLLFITLAAVLCGANGWEDGATFAEGAAAWLGEFIDVTQGTPRPDVFRRGFGRLNPDVFVACFNRWTQALATSLRGEVVAIDGKAVRSAFDGAARTSPLHLLHVWATRQGLLLHVAIVEGAASEIAAIPDALRLLDLAGAIVTLDANGLTQAVTAAARAADADYAITLKANRSVPRTQVAAAHDAAKARHFVDASADFDTTTDAARGRTEHPIATTVAFDPAQVPAAAGYVTVAARAPLVAGANTVSLSYDRAMGSHGYVDLDQLAVGP